MGGFLVVAVVPQTEEENEHKHKQMRASECNAQQHNSNREWRSAMHQ